MTHYFTTLENPKSPEELYNHRLEQHELNNRLRGYSVPPSQIVFVSKSADTTINDQPVLEFLRQDFVKRHNGLICDGLHGAKTFEDVQAEQVQAPRHMLSIAAGDKLIVDGQTIDTSAETILSNYTRTIKTIVVTSDAVYEDGQRTQPSLALNDFTNSVTQQPEFTTSNPDGCAPV